MKHGASRRALLFALAGACGGDGGGGSSDAGASESSTTGSGTSSSSGSTSTTSSETSGATGDETSSSSSSTGVDESTGGLPRSCEGDFECVDVLPGIQRAMEPADGECPAGSSMLELGSCEGCGCIEVASGTCVANGNVWDGAGCGQPAEAFMLTDNSCVAANGELAFNALPAPGVGGQCEVDPNTTDAVVHPLCDASALPGCGADQVCVPVGRQCMIVEGGSVECPAEFPEYGGILFTGTTCECSCQAYDECNVQVAAFSDGACQDDGVMVAADNACNEYPLGIGSLRGSQYVASTSCEAAGFSRGAKSVCCER
jgi:hypothetical protein